LFCSYCKCIVHGCSCVRNRFWGNAVTCTRTAHIEVVAKAKLERFYVNGHGVAVRVPSGLSKALYAHLHLKWLDLEPPDVPPSNKLHEFLIASAQTLPNVATWFWAIMGCMIKWPWEVTELTRLLRQRVGALCGELDAVYDTLLDVLRYADNKYMLEKYVRPHQVMLSSPRMAAQSGLVVFYRRMGILADTPETTEVKQDHYG
jgi:hypothetical protein